MYFLFFFLSALIKLPIFIGKGNLSVLPSPQNISLRVEQCLNQVTNGVGTTQIAKVI